VEIFIGEAVLFHLTGMKPNQEVKSIDLAKNGRIRRGDIALLRVEDRFTQEERPYLSVEAAKWLVKRGVKLIGIDRTLHLEKPGARAPNNLPAHDVLLRNGVPIIELLENLDKLRRKGSF
jgi:kynurenine formamidase